MCLFDPSGKLVRVANQRRATWAGILAVTWVLAFIIAEVIPFFSDLLALMSALFDSFFGWIFWGTAYLRMRRADLGPGFWKKRGIRGYAGFIVNICIIGIGFYFLIPGTYVSRPTHSPGSPSIDNRCKVSVQSIINHYNAGTVGSVFYCGDTSV